MPDSAQYPVQHERVGEQVWPTFTHTGVSQKQALPAQGTLLPLPSSVKHCSPEQQLASVAHVCEIPEHVGGGGAQTPLLH